MEGEGLTGKIIGCAFEVHKRLGAGYLEKVYENALCMELELAGLRVQQQAPIPVYYRDRLVGDFYADLLVEGCIIVEIKAVLQLTKEHEAQVVNYLAGSGIEDGLLLNFGPSVQVKHKYRTYRPRREKGDGQD